MANPNPVHFEAEMKVLIRILKQGPISAPELAKALGCSKPTAYTRLRLLGPRYGLEPIVTVDRRSSHGPFSVCYAL